jgi:Holliday junction DNA helicase RuvA
VREDAQILFGFMDVVDRDWFRTLIKVNGVGPRMALAILSGMSAEQLARTIDLEHLSVLQKIPGVGKKTAERLIIELQDKCRKWLASGGGEAQGASAAAERVAAGTDPLQAEQDAQYALIALGYKPTEASRVIRKVISPDATSEHLLQRALQDMVRA